MNTHRAGYVREDGSVKAIGSGSKAFCQVVAAEHREKNPEPERKYTIIEHECEGLPRDWSGGE